MNVIEAAVAPQREDAVAAAVERMTDHINVELYKLAEAGGDLNAVYRRPHGRDSREMYRTLAAKRGFLQAVTVSGNPYGVSRPGDPEIRIADACRTQQVLNNTAANASASFDLYVAKLNGKVGECVAAEVRGNLWNQSILTITRADGSVERWKTQCIINVSVLGKLFNQWPTRKVA